MSDSDSSEVDSQDENLQGVLDTLRQLDGRSTSPLCQTLSLQNKFASTFCPSQAQTSHSRATGDEEIILNDRFHKHLPLDSQSPGICGTGKFQNRSRMYLNEYLATNFDDSQLKRTLSSKINQPGKANRYHH